MNDQEVVAEERQDGFRPRKVRPEGWRDRALADGSIRAPGAPDPDEGADYSNAYVVAVPLIKATLQGV